MARFTDLGVARKRPKKTRYLETEGDGLYLEISPKGKKVWKRLHRTDTLRKWVILGNFPDVGVAEARKRNEEEARYLDRVATSKQALSHNSTLNELFEEWHGKAVDKKGKPWSEAYKRNVKYMFEADVLPVLGEKKIRDISKADIRVLLQKKEETKPGMALELYRRLSRIFNYAAQQDYIEVSPMASLESIGTQAPKNRYLSDKEIKIFLKSLPTPDMAPNTAHALELILRTGQRPSEVCGATTDEFQNDWWIIPGSRTKNGLEQRVPLTETIKNLFGEPNEHGLFFPSRRNAEKPINANVLATALRRSLTGKGKDRLGADGKPDESITIPIKEPFSPHDLRRTCATGLGSMGFSIEVIASVLNHKPRTVTGIHYMLHQFDKEKRRALLKWERKLDAITTGQSSDKVVNLR